MTYLEGADYFVRVVDLPYGVGAQTVPNEDGTFSMYLSGRTSHDQQIEDYLHEYEHIEDDDFYNDKSIEEIEKE